ncbi:MAG: DegT/DnrJ/EryC1/StrS family aminotransferase [Lentisphaeria bacterium]
MSNPNRTPDPQVMPANPKAEYEALAEAIDTAIAGTLENGRYILGPEVEKFEQDFAAFQGAGHCIGTGSGTEALHLALRAAGIGPGDAVITVSHTAVATVAAIELAGATPVMVDIKPDTFTIDPARITELLDDWEKHTAALGELTPRAIIPVHIYGHPADMPDIMQIAAAHNLLVIEDCAQAHGTLINGRMAGSWGDMAAFSFYPTKNLGAIGDAGAVITSNPELAESARLVREYGWAERYVSSIPGMNTRLDELQATILRVKLPHLNKWNEARREIATAYNDKLGSIASGALTIPPVKPHCQHVYHQYVLRLRNRDKVKQFLADQGVITLIHYPVPIHCQPAYSARGLTAGANLETTEQAAKEILSLPVHPFLTGEEVKQVITALKRVCESG